MDKKITPEMRKIFQDYGKQGWEKRKQNPDLKKELSEAGKLGHIAMLESIKNKKDKILK